MRDNFGLSLVAVLLTGASGLCSIAQQAPAAGQLVNDAATRNAEWVDARIAELDPKVEEKRFDEIGWAPTILAAERLGNQHRRPVFLFTHDGRINTGRC